MAVSNIQTEITIAITEIQKDILEALTDIYNEMTKKLIVWQGIGVCFNNQANTLRKISLEARDNINQCQKNGSEALQVVHDAIANQRSEIGDDFFAIYRKLEACLVDNRPPEIVLCLQGEVRSWSYFPVIILYNNLMFVGASRCNFDPKNCFTSSFYRRDAAGTQN